MGFGNKQPTMHISTARLTALAGGGAGAAAVAECPPGSEANNPPRRRVSLEPDVSRIRKRGTDETPEERKRRLAAKTVNFSATILARLVILGAAGFWMWNTYQFSGQIHRGVAIGMFVMLADVGRVSMKALEPGSK